MPPGALRADVVAGIAVALVLVSQSIAYAQLAADKTAAGRADGLLSAFASLNSQFAIPGARLLEHQFTPAIPLYRD